MFEALNCCNRFRTVIGWPSLGWLAGWLAEVCLSGWLAGWGQAVWQTATTINQSNQLNEVNVLRYLHDFIDLIMCAWLAGWLIGWLAG